MSATKTPTQRNCGAMVEQMELLESNPSLRLSLLDLEVATRARRATGDVVRRGLLTIPVIVHIVYKTDEQNISDGQVQSQIHVLNQDFRASNSDITSIPEVWRPLATDAQLEFRLADVTRTQTNRDFFVRTGNPVKFFNTGGHDVVSPDTHLNLWVCNLGNNLLGYAQFPGMPPETDGAVILCTAFGTEGTATDPFHLGRTATHEIGHYLNLHHIWGDSIVPNCGDDDFIDDTPRQLDQNVGKPSFPSISCNNGPNGDMFMNYMDYVDDEAMFIFTTQQVVRMRTALAEQRPNLGS